MCSIPQNVTEVIAFGSTGSLKVEIALGTLVVPDDYYSPIVPVTFFDDATAHM
jgi:purine nucleoside phosphorylase